MDLTEVLEGLQRQRNKLVTEHAQKKVELDKEYRKKVEDLAHNYLQLTDRLNQAIEAIDGKGKKAKIEKKPNYWKERKEKEDAPPPPIVNKKQKLARIVATLSKTSAKKTAKRKAVKNEEPLNPRKVQIMHQQMSITQLARHFKVSKGRVNYALKKAKEEETFPITNPTVLLDK